MTKAKCIIQRAIQDISWRSIIHKQVLIIENIKVYSSM